MMGHFSWYSIQVLLARSVLRISRILPELKESSTRELIETRSWLVVRPSVIVSAGKGLFTTRRIKNGEKICRYIGSRKNLLEVLRTRDKQYLFMIDYNTFIDAGPHEKMCSRFVNHHFDPCSRNVDFTIIDGVIWLVANRDVEPEEELYADYESFYWDVLGD